MPQSALQSGLSAAIKTFKIKYKNICKRTFFYKRMFRWNLGEWIDVSLMTKVNLETGRYIGLQEVSCRRETARASCH